MYLKKNTDNLKYSLISDMDLPSNLNKEFFLFW